MTTPVQPTTAGLGTAPRYAPPPGDAPTGGTPAGAAWALYDRAPYDAATYGGFVVGPPATAVPGVIAAYASGLRSAAAYAGGPPRALPGS
jgi:hypothetical protein